MTLQASVADGQDGLAQTACGEYGRRQTLWEELGPLPDGVRHSQIISWYALYATNYRNRHPPPEEPPEVTAHRRGKNRYVPSNLEDIIESHRKAMEAHHHVLHDRVMPILKARITTYLNRLRAQIEK